MLYPSQAYNMYINSVLLFFWQPTVQHGVALQKKTCKTWRCINCWSPFTLANARIKIKTTPWLGTSTAHRDLLVHAKEKQVRNNKNIKRWSRESEHSLLGNGKKNIVSYKFLLKCDAGEWPRYRSNIVNLPRCSCPLLSVSAFSCFASKFNNFRYSAQNSRFSQLSDF